MIQGVIQAQEAIIFSINNSVTNDWDYIVLNFEYENIDGEEVTDSIIYSACGDTSSDHLLSEETRLLILKLRELMTDQWESFTLEVKNTGQFKFYFDYDKPKRLNGIFTPESMLENYQIKI